jgi:5-methyltetrahydropteroyltriglutamate--homocysteine methyltransferase
MAAMAVHPPFRAEHIGSLLRPPALLALRQRVSRGEVSADELAAAEERAIAEAVALQQRIGLRLATDGEFRRRSYHSYFYAQLGDVAPDAVTSEIGDASGRAAQPVAVIKTKLRWTHPIHVDDFKRLKALTTALPKITIPGPCALHFRGGDKAVTAHAYRDLDEFWNDTVAAYHHELAALAAAGCRYVQIDETAFAKFSDPAVQAMLAARGEDWRKLIDTYIAVTNRVLTALASACTCAAAIAAAIGTPKAATRRSRTSCSTRSISSSSFWSTIRRAPAISRRCASCRRESRSFSASFRPRRRCSRTRPRSRAGSRRRAATSRSIGWH